MMHYSLSDAEVCPEMHANETHELYDGHHRCPVTLILTKTQIILSNMKLYENDKNLSDIKYPNSGLAAFLDISVEDAGIFGKKKSGFSQYESNLWLL